MKKESLKLILGVLLCVMALACSKEQDNQNFVPILPGDQKLQLAKIGYSLQMDLNTRANQTLFEALDTFAYYIKKPGFPLLWIQLPEGYELVTGHYAFNPQIQTWQRLGTDTCMRLTVPSAIGDLEMRLCGGNTNMRYEIGGQVCRLPNHQSMQFRQNSTILLNQQGSFEPYGSVGADSIFQGVRSEMSMQATSLQINATFLADPQLLDVSLQIDKGLRMLLQGHMAYQNQSWNLDVNVMNKCYIYSSIANMSVFRQSLQACAGQFPKVDGLLTESYCRAVRDTIKKYVPTYLNFDHSQTPAVELIPEYAFVTSASGTSYDIFPVMRFSDGSLNSMEEFVSYQKWTEIWNMLKSIYGTYR